MAKLLILSGKRQGAEIELDLGDTDIGNRKSAKLRIRDPWISYNHAKISGQDGRFFIEDLGSSNGTWINGEKIRRQELAANALIYFGKTKVKFTLSDGAAAPEELGEKPGETPWWDKVLEDTPGRKGGADRTRLRRLETEVRDERRMRQALEKFLQLPPGSSVGDAAGAGELEQKVKQLEEQLAQAPKSGGGGESVADAVDAERSRTEKLRRDHMSTIVELEGKVAQAESHSVELEGRLKNKTEQIKKEITKAKEKGQAEIDELKTAVEEARKSASSMASGGDEALQSQAQRAEKLEKELDEWKEKAKGAEERADALDIELKDAKASGAAPAGGGGGGSEKHETLKSQLWASIEEATKWKEEAAQSSEDLEAARADVERYKEEHGQILQEIDEISMEQIEVEEELNARIEELEGILDENNVDYPKMEGGEDDEGSPKDSE